METIRIYRRGFVNRLIIPVGIVLLVTLVTSIIYEHAWKLKDMPDLYLFSPVFTVLMFLSIFFGILYIYPATFFRGAGKWERMAASLVPILVWMVREMVRIGRVFSFGESLYFGLNPLFVIVLLFAVFQMGLCDLFCRWRFRRRSRTRIKLLSGFTAILLFGGLVSLMAFLTKALPIGILYFEVYKTIFA
ncbi:MAG: hypothetical protein GY866_15910 [Proteobacteria bacterium]|nr:hypothetical protein [Pseudomonadota bacterium]